MFFFKQPDKEWLLQKLCRVNKEKLFYGVSDQKDFLLRGNQASGMPQQRLHRHWRLSGEDASAGRASQQTEAAFRLLTTCARHRLAPEGRICLHPYNWYAELSVPIGYNYFRDNPCLNWTVVKRNTEGCEIHWLITHFWVWDEQSSQCKLKSK